MANTGYDQKGSVAHLTHTSATDWDGTDITDTNELASDAVSMSKLVTRVYTITSVCAAAATTGSLYVSILGSDLDPDSEGYQVGPLDGGAAVDPCWTVSMSIDDAETRKLVIPVDGSQRPRHKLSIRNSTGQTQTTTVNYIDMDIPVASA